ncbi:cytochrome P450 [Lophiostoma macrostomum CBS 122681]|uniref:Cytochrome P450 n=1 Tax=Lophiostoma macrostomum CBS 122681 TaxID=1314788 RepID=A0A6A6TPK8_9PLEO|nr:cytochrome P450 [Lophiostoma macrostomum CBS 122681]
MLVVTFRHRSRINRLRLQGFPMPGGWSWLFGHSFVLLRYTKRFPPLANIGIPMQELSKQFTHTEIQPRHSKINPSKPPMAGESVEPIVGGPSILSVNTAEWKKWRSLLNPGFSTQSLMGHVPFITDCAQVFCDKLRMAAGRELFSLDEYATRLTFDIIMKDPRVLMNPLRPIIQKYYSRKLVFYIDKELHRRFEELKTEQRNPIPANSKRPLSVASLALQAYISENRDQKILRTARLDKDFAAIVSNHIRLFLFAGNDTTSATICFALHKMSTEQEATKKLQEEHDHIFGRDVSKTAELLRAQPTLLNRCRYTMAFVKETLRLYPPAANMRLGTSQSTLPALNGETLPIEGLNVILMHQAIHTNPRIWLRPNDFIPERFLVEPDHDLYPPDGAFRPFDIGPRCCIGQELSLIEIRIVLIMTARTFGFRAAYDEYDRIDTVRGDRVFQTEKAGTHPSDGYPCRVDMLTME